MKTKKSGFTLVEVFIVMVIIGLLAAITIPAFQKVKYSSIHKSITQGEIVSPSDFKAYKAYVKEHPSDFVNNREVKPSVEAEQIDTIVINGKTYRLVPQ